jgi:hypothetical protein
MESVKKRRIRKTVRQKEDETWPRSNFGADLRTRRIGKKLSITIFTTEPTARSAHSHRR